MPNRSIVLLWLLVASGAWLYAFPAANIPYAIVVLLHIGAGVALPVSMVVCALRTRHAARRPTSATIGWLFTAVGAAIGLALIYTGTSVPMRPWLYAHIALSALGAVVLAGDRLGRHGWLTGSVVRASMRYATALVAVIALGVAAWAAREMPWYAAYRIKNPTMPPATMDEEGNGRNGPFFPSSIRTADGKTISSKFFMQSDGCKRCHSDIFAQWDSSAHHFSSFNNQWYRKSIEYMQEVAGVQSSKWCGGCHDPAVIFSGMMDTPIEKILTTPEAQVGLGCNACHAIVAVDSTMGQGGYTIEYPKLSDLAASERPAMRWLHDFLVKVNPEPHRRTFMKPFMNTQQADFCSSCHKVHLDMPVNRYRWIRGFNDYDNWQASGVSGFGARSFYYPPKPQKCVDCHMPLVPSRDFGHDNGFVKSHRFPAANTALPFVNHDRAQLDATEKFLKDNIVSIDIFAISTAKPVEGGAMLPRGELATTFAVGEEGEMGAGRGMTTEAVPISAPLNRVNPLVRRGDSVRVDVVARTRKVGHFFPGGTVDAFDVWVELKATDDNGRVLFWSGRVEDEGRGPVEKGAHFYRSLLVDEAGNPINKRNAWASRAVVYVRLIPPGAADTVHYRLQVPKDAGSRINLEAKLHYRKFMWWNTQFAFAGEAVPRSGDVTPAFDNRKFLFTGDTRNVSGGMKEIPNLPIVTLAESRVTLGVADGHAPEPPARVELKKEDWQRWNDFGIGLFLQGDLKGAEAAFQRVTEIDPKNPDGWVNVGRVRVQEGNMDGGREVLTKALSLAPDLARAQFFLARVLRADGQLEEAAAMLRRVLDQYPRDRVVRNDLGRVFFLQRRYGDAIREFEHTLDIDPEDLQAHYNLMLCYNGLGQEARAREHEKRYLRFKADEASQAITGPYRRDHPEDNNERQAIHEHTSAPLGGSK
jgi:cytochrome c-type biogenesis protein CcmH/NrfG